MLDFQLYLRSLSQSQDLGDTKKDAVDASVQNAEAPYRETFGNYLQQATQKHQSSPLSTHFSPLKTLPDLKVAAQVSQHNVFSALALPSSWVHKNTGLKTQQTQPAGKDFLYQIFAVGTDLSNAPIPNPALKSVEADSRDLLSSETAYYVLFLTSNGIKKDAAVQPYSVSHQENRVSFESAEPPSFSSMGAASIVPLSYRSSAFVSLPVAPGVLVVLEKGDLSSLAKGEVFQNVLKAYDVLKDTRAEVASALMHLMTKASFSSLTSVSPAPVAAAPDSEAPVVTSAPVVAAPDSETPVVSPAPVVTVPESEAPVVSPAPVAAAPESETPVVSPAPVAAAPDSEAPVVTSAPVVAAPESETPVVSPAPVVTAPESEAPVVSPAPVVAAPESEAPVVSPAPVVAAPESETPVVSPAPVVTAPESEAPVVSPAPVAAAPDSETPVVTLAPVVTAPDSEAPVATLAPVVTAPESETPVATPAPVAAVPESETPVATPAPVAAAPDSETPIVTPAPVAAAPESEAPVVSPAPVAAAPESEAPVVSPAPVAAAPESEAPVVSPAPVVAAPESETPVVSPAPVAAAPESETPVVSPAPVAAAPDSGNPVVTPAPVVAAPDSGNPVVTPAPVAAAPDSETPAPVTTAPEEDAPLTSEALSLATTPEVVASVSPERVSEDASFERNPQDTVVQLASLPFIAFYAVQIKPQNETKDLEQGGIAESSPELALQQNVFLYQLAASYLERALSQGRKSRGPVARPMQLDTHAQQNLPPFSWSASEMPAGLVLQLPESSFQPVLDTWLKGALKVGENAFSDQLGAEPKRGFTQPLKISEVSMGQLSSARVEPDALQKLMQSSVNEGVAPMTFADFMSVHEVYESVLPAAPRPIEHSSAADTSSSWMLEGELMPSLSHLNGVPQSTGLSFSHVASGLIQGLAELGVQVSELQGVKVSEALPPDVRMDAFAASSRGERQEQRQSPTQESTVAQDHSPTQSAQRMNLSASQVIQAINQNIPVHIADFPAFVSRVLQVQPPTVTQPQALQVTLSPDSLGKITAQFELTAQNTVNITFLSQSAMTVDKIGSYLQEIQQIIGSTQFAPGQIMVRQGIPLAKQSQSFDQQSQSERDSDDEQQKIQRRGGQRRRRSDDEEISIDVTV